jgi:NAD(P)-dependent dehydrogenase (short-subunit alcohol dehydrogenase family)
MKRSALITGGARGLGRAIAARLAKDGHAVVLADIDATAAEQTARELAAAGASALALAVDVGDEASVAKLFQDIERRNGGLDILVNNAGVPGMQGKSRVAIEDMTLDTWETTLRINVTGPLLMCRAAVPLMKRGGYGRIVNISSRAARGRPARFATAYAASKSALVGLTQVLAGEVGPAGITVNCVAPSLIETDMAQAVSGGRADYFQRAIDSAPVGRLGTAADVADAVSFLCSDDAAFITGTVVDVNGGAAMS